MKLYEACMGYDYEITHSGLFTDYEEAMVWIKLRSNDFVLCDAIVIYTYDTDKKETSGELLHTHKYTLKNKRF